MAGVTFRRLFVANLVMAMICPLAGAVGVAVAEAPVVAGPVLDGGRRVAVAGPLTIDGHGWGHGIGLSQWGALGYAINSSWSAAQILDHYYGGTVASTAPNIDITVRLTLLDGLQTAVVHDKGTIVINGFAPPAGQPVVWRSLVAREISEGHYRVWGRNDTTACPGTSLDLDNSANGWTVVIPDQATSVTFRPQADTSASTDVGDLLGLCEPTTGRVRYYRGAIRAINSSLGANRTVSQVPLEQYLRSVVGGEVSYGWAAMGQGKGAQALQAQAVAARSYGLAENKDTYARTCDNICQTYRGAAYRPSVGSPLVAQEFGPTDAAVAATAGVVRRYGSESGAVAYTMFSSSSGGFTAANTLGFTPVVDDGDAVAGNNAHSWTVTLDPSTIQAAWPSIGTFSGLQVTSRDGGGEWGGRVATITVSGSAGSVNLSGSAFRLAVGLKSALFQIRGAETPPPPPPPADPCSGRYPSTVPGAGANSVASRFTALTPIRLIDTRSGFGTAAVPLAGGCTLTIQPGVPADATAVVVNVTSVGAQVNGFLTAYPCGAARPLASIVPSVAGRIVPGTAVVPLSADGTFCVFSSTSTDLVVDLTGVYQIGGGQAFQPINPVRSFDSRSGPVLPIGAVVRVQIAGRQGVPAGATAAAVTVHSTDALGPGFVTIWPCGVTRPTTSILNATTGSAVTNHAQVGLDGYGGVCLFASNAMHLVLDLSGWFGPTASTVFHAVTPQRVLDTRAAVGLSGAFAANQNRAVTVIGAGSVPGSGVAAVAAEITETGATQAGYITVHPCMAAVPNLSMVRNFANSVAATTVAGIVDGFGRWCLKPNVAMDMVIDVSGWYGAS
ncbi:unannotated protein [freshwater metagenome]|uniref:Unannotated protein n=1 Tax=freshwater metagenome TaxID=449393 RepID=A0A6J7EQB4_9ZZZZ